MQMHRKSVISTFLLDPVMSAVDLLLPPRCIGTGEIVTHQGMISSTLWQQLDFIGTPLCRSCGLPFEFFDATATADEIECASCIQEPPKFDSARAALVYNDASRALLLRFKYGDQLHAAVTFANWIKNAAPDTLAEADYITPVPLHWQRLWQRRFNQSALIASALARLSDKPVLHALTRRRFTGSQKGLSRRDRQKNVRMAFLAHPKNLSQLQNKHIILIDDVMTSGATVSECAKVLKRAGAKRVSVLTVARVLKDPGHLPENEDIFADEGY